MATSKYQFDAKFTDTASSKLDLGGEDCVSDDRPHMLLLLTSPVHHSFTVLRQSCFQFSFFIGGAFDDFFLCLVHHL